MEYMLIDVNERNNSPRNITIQFKAFDSVGLMFPDSVLYDVTTEYDVCALFDIPYVGVVLIDKIMSVLVNQKTCIHQNTSNCELYLQYKALSYCHTIIFLNLNHPNKMTKYIYTQK